MNLEGAAAAPDPSLRSSRATPTSADREVINVARFLPQMARSQPGALALRIPRGRDRQTEAIRYLDLTFAELDRETNAWAHRLASVGVRRGTRVLLLVRPGLSLIALCFALFKTGAVPVVIDPGMGLRTFLRCVARTAPEAVVAIPRGILLSHLFRRAFRGVRIRLSVSDHQRLTSAPPGIASTDRLVQPEHAAPVDCAPTRADELAAILFTSGSTGVPKGVCYEHGMFEAQVRLIRETYQLEPGEIDLPMLPVFALFNPALGMTTVVPEIDPSRPATVDPAKIVQAISQCGVTNSFGSPVLWRKLTDHCLARGITLPSLRRVLSAGAPVPPALMADFKKIAPQATMHSPYGATEALPVATVSDREILEFAAARTRAGAGTCVGRPVRGVAVRIIRLVDGPITTWNDDLVLSAGEIGEIVAGGPQVTRRYDAVPEATVAAKIADAAAPADAFGIQHSSLGNPNVWHRMGDCGYFDADGRLWFCGRKAERVRTREGDLFTDRCEPVFNQHPLVARTALIGLGTPGAQEPAIVVELKSSRENPAPTREQIARELRELGRACETTRAICAFFFHPRLPVDVRHNAKIHRLTLTRHFAAKEPIRVP